MMKNSMVHASTKPPRAKSNNNMNLPLLLADSSPELHVSYLQQGISAYIESIQNVCKTGCWLADSLSTLLEGTDCQITSTNMKEHFLHMLEISVRLSVKTKNELACLLMELTLPNHNNNNHIQEKNKWKLQNAQILESCIFCLEQLHASVFGTSLCEKPKEKDRDTQHIEISENHHPYNSSTELTSFQETSHQLEWKQLCSKKFCTESWKSAKQLTNNLRKCSGLTENEIQNLLKPHSIADAYLCKLNGKISMGLKEYETVLHAMSLPMVTVRGAFCLDQLNAREMLAGCCSKMEIEQGIQRPPAKQFLHCELPLINFKLSKGSFPAGATNAAENSKLKKDAVASLVQVTNRKLTSTAAQEFTSEVLGEICPARWRCHVKAVLQLLFGNSGLVVLDTVESETKQWATIQRKSSLIVVTVPSTWCIKEDPGTMILLHKDVDPDKTLGEINVRYIAVFNTKSEPSHTQFEPAIFVEVTLMNGKTKPLATLASSLAPTLWSQHVLGNKLSVKKSPAMNISKTNFKNWSISTTTIVSSACTASTATDSEALAANTPEDNSESEAIQDAIKLLSVNLDAKNSKGLDKFEEKTKEELQNNEKSTAEKDVKSMNKATSPHSKSKTLPILRQSTSAVKSNSYNHLQRYPKSASFSAFDRAKFKYLNKPLTLVHPAVSARRSFSAANTFLQTVQQQPVMYLQPGVVKHGQMPFPVFHATNRTVHTEQPRYSSPVLIQSPVSNQIMLQSSITPSPSPNTFLQPQSEMLKQPHNNYDLPQALLSSSSELNLASMSVPPNSLQGVNVVLPSYETQHMFPEKQGLANSEMLSRISGNVSSNEDMSTTEQVNTRLLEQNILMNLHMSGASTKLDKALLKHLPIQTEDLNVLPETANHIEPSTQQNNFGPIGSPATSRRMSQMDDNRKGSNTWPNASNATALGQFSTNPAGESEYAQYIAGINNALQKKAATWDCGDTKQKHGQLTEHDIEHPPNAPFNVFSVPDLFRNTNPRNNSKTTSEIENLESPSDLNSLSQPAGWLPW